MTNQDEKLNEILEDCVDKYFPKGDKRRGEALVLMAKAHIEIEKARQQERKRIIEMIELNYNHLKGASATYFLKGKSWMLLEILDQLKNSEANGK
jgi:hypothetical protein